ncbi:hypothetical protein IWW38_002904 [Coemansia aciculifera]|uniref:Uncharacterized protein n=1 Tax=Coemansia aciculifera TaxID=417176 RepID=A0ACC1M3T9_9FUNG|nr:hypothetical protein IWW38_002904 [Coemansia aciculifera]
MTSSSDAIDKRTSPIDLSQSARSTIKRVFIELDEWFVCSGKASSMLELVPLGRSVAPRAQTIMFTFLPCTPEMSARINQSEMAANVATFVSRIKQMTPNVREVRVGSRSTISMTSITPHFGSLISQLTKIAGSFEYIHFSDSPAAPMKLTLPEIHGLTQIKLFIAYPASDVDQFIRLIRQNAPTLLTIHIQSLYEFDTVGLVVDRSGRYIKYPRLTSLSIGEPARRPDQRPSTPSHIVPFPSLRQLRFVTRFPFDDDTLFRGNTGTLESLSVKFDVLSIAMLRSHNVFTLVSHPKLQYVRTGYVEGTRSVLPALSTKYLQFALSIGPAAPARDIDVVFGGRSLEPALSILGNHSCIQVLSLSNEHLAFWTIVAVIKSLPLLSDLSACLRDFHPMPAGVTHDELPVYVVSTYAPMSKRLRCLNVKVHRFSDVADAAKMVLLLALACPNFDYAAVAPTERKQFMKLLERNIASDMFKEHAPRLRRLLFHGWDAC